ncbi:MAG: tetratricopeptide repeat-containing sensor histidine kinase [Rhizobacter sp.]|nr:tetratricopeptide repeat-containing sensor histidine kinase [Ferruginibacter sp.]
MRTILFITVLFTSVSGTAQLTGRQLADSMIQAIPGAPDDSIKARLYNRIFNELVNIDLKEALQYAHAGLIHTKKMKWPKGIGTFQDNLGRASSSLGNYDSCIYYYTESLNTNKAAGNKQGMANNYNNLGVAAQNIRADFTTAADYYFKSLYITEEIKDSMGQSNALLNIAAIYMMQKNYDKSLEFNKRSLRIRGKLGNPDALAACLQSIGKVYLLLKDNDKAKENFQKALNIFGGSGNIAGMAAAWSAMALVYGNNYRAVAEARIRSKKLWDELNPLHTEAITNLGNLGILYLDIARYDSLHLVKYDALIPDNKISLLDKAAGHLKKAVEFAEQTGDIDNRSYFIGALAEVQEQQGDFKNAYYNYKFFKETEDSIYSQESKNKIAEAESRRVIEINELALSNQRKTTGGLIGGVALLSAIGFLLYRQTLSRKKANHRLTLLNKELDDANQAKARFFALMSHDLRSPVSKLINFLHLQKNDPELLTPELKEIHNKKITEGAEALLDNMENMLLWSKSQMEQFKPFNKPVDIALLFEKLQRSFAGQEDITYNFHHSLSHPVITDDNYLFSILHNLIQNATQALNGTPDATIECMTRAANNSIIFSVKDNGPGYPQNLLSENYSEISITSGKTGLGLFMIHDMAAAIHGKIHLANNNAGATATLQLNT